MKFAKQFLQLSVLALGAAAGGFVAVSIGGDPVTAERGRMLGAVPMMSQAEVRAANVASSTDLATTTITPVRIVDTRPGAGSLGGAKVPWEALETRTVEAAGLGSIPTDAVGVVVNVTALNATTSDTFLTLFPTGSVMPNASTLNPPLGEVAFNAATVLLGPDGTFEVYNYSGTVDVIVDVTAYLTRTLAESVEGVESEVGDVVEEVDTIVTEVDAVEQEVDEVAEEVGRLQTGELLSPLLPLEDRLYAGHWASWKAVNADIFGASVDEERYGPSVLVEARMIVTVNQYPNAEVCVRLRNNANAIPETETCADSESPQYGADIPTGFGYQGGKYVRLVTPRVFIESGNAGLEMLVRAKDGYSCPDDPAEYDLCFFELNWAGLYAYPD